MLQVSKVNHRPLVFSARNSNEDSKDKSPISKVGEDAVLLKGTAFAGLAVGGRALLWLCEEGFEFDILWEKGKKLVDKYKSNAPTSKKDLLYVGAFGALVVGFVAGVAALYTLYKTPEILYKGKVNAFTKGKDMDLYIKSNDVEKDLYNQMIIKSQNATPEEKEILKQQYLKLKAAKNQVPASIVNSKN